MVWRAGEHLAAAHRPLQELPQPAGGGEAVQHVRDAARAGEPGGHVGDAAALLDLLHPLAPRAPVLGRPTTPIDFDLSLFLPCRFRFLLSLDDALLLFSLFFLLFPPHDSFSFFFLFFF